MHCSATRSRSPNEQPNPAATFRIDPGRNRVSRLTDLLAQAKARDAQMGADLEREFQALSSRLPLRLNFERHRPEAVELPNRVRPGSSIKETLNKYGTHSSRASSLPQNQAMVGASLLATILVQTFLGFRRSREGGNPVTLSQPVEVQGLWIPACAGTTAFSALPHRRPAHVRPAVRPCADAVAVGSAT